MVWALVLVWASGAFEITTGWPTIQACAQAAHAAREDSLKTDKPITKAVCMNVRKITS